MRKVFAIALIVAGLSSSVARACLMEAEQLPRMLTEPKVLISAYITRKETAPELVQTWLGGGRGLRTGTILTLKTVATYRGRERDIWRVLYRGAPAEKVFSSDDEIYLFGLNEAGFYVSNSPGGLYPARDSNGRIVHEMYQRLCTRNTFIELDWLQDIYQTLEQTRTSCKEKTFRNCFNDDHPLSVRWAAAWPEKFRPHLAKILEGAQ